MAAAQDREQEQASTGAHNRHALTDAAAMRARHMSGRAKAAVIVRLMLAEGAQMPLDALPDHLQAALTEQMGRMGLVDRATLDAIVTEFAETLESVGLSFPGGIDGALNLLGGQITPGAVDRLRRMAGSSFRADPWERIANADTEQLVPVLLSESTQVAAVMLSKLSVARAAALLQELPGERARRIAHAVALTGDVDPDTVCRIGQAIAAQIEARPPRAFARGPVERVGAILNSTPGALRETVLEGLEAADGAFAANVRKAIFTFLHIPDRLAPRDVPRILREVEQPVLVTALAAALAEPESAAAHSGEFLLDNISQRLAASLREEIAEHGKVGAQDGEVAMATIVTAIRALEEAGELQLLPPSDEQ